MRLTIPGVLSIASLLAVPLLAESVPYQKPSQEILDILTAPVLPSLSVNPTGTYATLAESPRYRALETIEHVNWEKLRWFDLHVKNAPPLVGSK